MRNIIIYCGHFELPDKNALAHRVKSNCYALIKSGFQPIMISYNKQYSNIDILDSKTKDGIFEYFYVNYPSTIIEWLQDCFTYRKIEQVIEYYGYESIHSIVITSIGCINTIKLMSICKKHNIHLISDSVDWFEKYTGNIIKRTINILDDKIMMTFLRPKIHNIICISEYLQKYFNSKDCNTLLIPSLTFKEDKRFDNLNSYQRIGKKTYTYVGSPGVKGSKDRIDWCVLAFYEIFYKSECEMHIYGIEREEFIVQFNDLACLVSKATNIFFHGRCDNSICLEAIKKSDFFMFARENNLTTKAGFPTKLSESFACGTPVITTPSGDIEKYVRDFKNGFVSKMCTYESFKEAVECTDKLSEQEIVEMHNYCKNNTVLDVESWIDKIKSYFNLL